MKIGIVATAWGVNEFVQDSLSAWIFEKENNKEHEFLI
jgi:hypothetical protein